MRLEEIIDTVNLKSLLISHTVGMVNGWGSCYFTPTITFQNLVRAIFQTEPFIRVLGLFSKWIITIKNYISALKSSAHQSKSLRFLKTFSRFDVQLNSCIKTKKSVDTRLLRDYLDSLNRSAVLLSEAEALRIDIPHDDGNKEAWLRKYIVDEFISFRMSFEDSDLLGKCPLTHCYSVKDLSLISKMSLQIQPRHLISSAINKCTFVILSTPASRFIDHVADTNIAISVFSCQLIVFDEWFHQFASKVSRKTDLCERFTFAIYQLILCGFIVRSRRQKHVFEKASSVWSY